MGILSRLILVLSIILFVPTALIIVSQNAVPGDKTYPIKRDIEGTIARLASLTPQTRAFFSVGLTNRRYKEAVALMKKGESSKASLNELVMQTQTAAQDINTVSNTETKKQLVASLTKQIDEYDQGLAGFGQQQSPLFLTTTTPEPTVIPKSEPTPTPTPVVIAIKPTTTPILTRSAVIVTPVVTQPEVTQIPIAMPTSTVVPATPSIVATTPDQSSADVEETRQQLKRIRDELLSSTGENNEERRNSGDRNDPSKESRRGKD